MRSHDEHRYRPEIDGLRALAVVAVVIFHAFPSYAPGGFRGVDIFFVISGYLITGILLRDIAADRYTLREFYRRRIRRLFPALSIMLSTLLAVGLFVLLPFELLQLGKHVVSGTFFVSNLALWAEVGYFDGASVNKPLLHLWSLGVEEQFYFVWPLLIAFAVRRRAVFSALGFAILTSFTVASLSARMSPGGGFYNPLSRFWELGVGAALVHGESSRYFRALTSRRHYPALASLFGFAAIALSFREHHDASALEGAAWRGLLPTVGAALVISAGQKSFLNRAILSSKPVVWCGQISYPLYLWHWPLLSIPQIVLARTPAPAFRLGALAASLLLAQLTYSQIERRIRTDGASLLGRTQTWIGAMVVVATIAAGMWWAKGLPTWRGPWNVTNIAGFGAVTEPNSPGCAKRYGPRIESGPENEWFCHANFGTEASPEVVVLGDSHSQRLAWGLRELGEIRVLNLSKGACLPFSGYEAARSGHSEALGCAPTMSNMLDVAIAEHPLRGVVLTGFFSQFYDGRVSLRTKAPLKDLMRSTLAHLSSTMSRVVIMLDVPELELEPAACVERPYRRWMRRRQSMECEFSRARAMSQRSGYEADLREVAATLPNVTFFDPWDLICEGDRCSPIRDGELLYDDRNHLSRVGATLVARRMLDSSLH